MYFFQVRKKGHQDSRVQVHLKDEARDYLFWPKRKRFSFGDEQMKGVLPRGDLYLVPTFGVFGPAFEVQDAYGNYAYLTDELKSLIDRCTAEDGEI